MANYSFSKGYDQVKRKDLADVRKEIMNALGVRNRTTFYNRLNGKIEPTKSEFDTIEAIFKKRGITSIWGN